MDTTTLSSGLARLTADIAARAPEIERSRRLPAPLIAALTQAGYLRMLVPKAYGGDACELPDVLRAIETLAGADGATGWVVGQVASAQLILTHFPQQAQEAIYANGPDVFAAGAVAPKGRASREGDSWRVTGQWPFVSGCEDASWIYVQSMVVSQHRLQMHADGTPVLRMAVFPAAEVEVLDTWSVSGLKGTGSHDVRLTRARCPEWRTAELGSDGSRADGTIFRIPLLDQGGLYIAAVALGIAQGAMDDAAALAAGGKRPAFSRERLSASPVFRDRLGEAYMQLESARALLYAKAGEITTAMRGGGTATVQQRAVLRATTATTVAAAARVVDDAYALAGGSALYDSSSLQRRLRDIHAATQHAYAGRHHFSIVGGLLAGETIDPARF